MVKEAAASVNVAYARAIQLQAQADGVRLACAPAPLFRRRVLHQQRPAGIHPGGQIFLFSHPHNSHLSQALGLTNVFFIDGDAAALEQYFAPGEVDLIYINFCDPWPSVKHSRNPRSG